MIFRKWIHITFINLLIVAFLGVVMRYKIAYSLPFIDQKNFLHAHSHFAFSGWLTQLLMTLMVMHASEHLPRYSLKKYKFLLTANLVVAYGMLITFLWEGYGTFSIIFSTVSIFVAYTFAIVFWKDLNKISKNKISHHWFKAALLFNAISSLGPYALAYMMGNNIQHPSWLLASTYYFLHFQYNGWFFFACMGLLSEKVLAGKVPWLAQKICFWCFAIACIPAYFLSALWLPIPFFIYILVVIASLLQLAGWIIILSAIIKFRSQIFSGISGHARNILILSAIAFSIKLLLQAGSSIPFLSHLAFGFRPVVIGYLHLVLLGVLTLFLIGYCKTQNLLAVNKTIDTGIIIFIAGIILNELFLLIQGLSYMNGTTVFYINELLLAAALILFAGIFLLNKGNWAGDKFKRQAGPI